MNGREKALGLTAVLLLLGLSDRAGAQEPHRPLPQLFSDIAEGEPDRSPALLLPWGATPKDIPEGYMIIEGDIQVPIGFDQVDMPWATNFWPDGIVPYQFNANVTSANRTAMRNAMAEWMAVANVSFVEAISCDLGTHCVGIQNSDHNDSPVGRQPLGIGQTINIRDWGSRFTMVHELAHTLGFHHEQSRTDRDTYVRINLQNIQSGQESNFDLEGGSGRYGPYDFDSVMHYGQYDFTICSPAHPGCETITVLPPNQSWQTRIGQRNHLSRMDQLIMGFIYPFGNWRFVDRSYSGDQVGTFLQPFRDFIPGYNATPSGGTLWVQPGAYAARATFSRPMTWQAPLGGVTLN